MNDDIEHIASTIVHTHVPISTYNATETDASYLCALVLPVCCQLLQLERCDEEQALRCDISTADDRQRIERFVRRVTRSGFYRPDNFNSVFSCESQRILKID